MDYLVGKFATDCRNHAACARSSLLKHASLRNASALPIAPPPMDAAKSHCVLRNWLNDLFVFFSAVVAVAR